PSPTAATGLSQTCAGCRNRRAATRLVPRLRRPAAAVQRRQVIRRPRGRRRKGQFSRDSYSFVSAVLLFLLSVSGKATCCPASTEDTPESPHWLHNSPPPARSDFVPNAKQPGSHCPARRVQLACNTAVAWELH